MSKPKGPAPWTVAAVIHKGWPAYVIDEAGTLDLKSDEVRRRRELIANLPLLLPGAAGVLRDLAALPAGEADPVSPASLALLRRALGEAT